MVLFIAIFVLTYVLIIHPRVNKHYAAFAGGIMVMVAGWFLEKIGKEGINETELIHHLEGDFLILAIIIGNLLVVDVGLKSGLFHYISIKILKLTEGDPDKLLIYMGILCIVLSIIINNISAILITASLTVLACERLDYDPFPYIMAEMVLVNVGGIFALTSSIPNIIIGAELEIDYIAFLKIGAIVATFLIFLSFLLFKFMLKIPKTGMDEAHRKRIVKEFDEWAAVTNMKVFWSTVIVIVGMIILFILSGIIGMGLATISLLSAGVLITLTKADFDHSIEGIDWPLLSFFLGLFICIAALDISGVMSELAEMVQNTVGDNEILAIFVILFVSGILSGIVDNIVVAAAFAPIIVTVAASPELDMLLLGWALILGCNLGGNLSPVGAPSNVIGINILAKRGKVVSWGEWKLPASIVMIQLVAGFIFLILASLII